MLRENIRQIQAKCIRLKGQKSTPTMDTDIKKVGLKYYLLLIVTFTDSNASDAEAKLFAYLFTDYNRLIRPVHNNTDVINVEFGLTMSQLIDVVIIDFVLVPFLIFDLS